ncbi:MAG: DUF177 domain-containing protein [Deltaproteobacteria bacterium]|nr:DUF177 domain-containing protein [Deltaproteobacteria bacterium]
MKIKISEIPVEGVHLTAELASDPWFGEVVRETFRKDSDGQNKASASLFLEKTCDNISLRGVASLDLKQECDRCLDFFPYHLSVPIEMTLAPLQNVQGGEKTEELTTEDENFSFYKGEEINLSEIIRETLVLALPIRYLCQESCKGICPQCGINLNHNACNCHDQTGHSQFAVLKKFNFRKK